MTPRESSSAGGGGAIKDADFAGYKRHRLHQGCGRTSQVAAFDLAASTSRVAAES